MVDPSGATSPGVTTHRRSATPAWKPPASDAEAGDADTRGSAIAAKATTRRFIRLIMPLVRG